MLTDFNRLKVFYTIYRHKSAAAAARELYISQSAVSQSLGKLERELKNQLFVRQHKKLVPTAAAGWRGALARSANGVWTTPMGANVIGASVIVRRGARRRNRGA